ncbi:hypothetical protein RHGRI_017713 [Rhododendron griersonianum]|uniref:Uncharacterized protein n=1 Tax=Rhododendron griersonianum TaxID=479676 RepID=A0AAV6JYV5_9ERIC|nr:hypothetical protein RHGRI_017713 [Rhododendron griersonianum]
MMVVQWWLCTAAGGGGVVVMVVAVVVACKVYALSVVGGIPDELWSVTYLTNLNLALNYLTGPLSSSIANLTQMEYLSLGINSLSGEVPKELGNLTNLISLSFSSNSFSGPLPSELGNLTKLQQLILRNSKISGPIPSNIGDYQSLSLLFLGNNKLNETLPALKSSSLLNILGGDMDTYFENLYLNKVVGTDVDVSYNELSGSLPSWIGEQGLQLNLVANNFTIESANNSFLPPGLSCLQSNFPCFRNSPIYFNFSIKCGGPQITTIDQTVQTVYEKDNKTLGPATYYVTSTKRWAISNVGRFINVNDPFYLDNSTQNFTSTLDKVQSEMFQTARMSPDR